MARSKGDVKQPRKPRKSKSDKANQGAAPQPSPSSASGTSGKTPAPDDVRDLVETLAAYDDQKKEISDSSRETTADAIESKHFDPAALRWARMLYKSAKKDPEKFAISLPHFLSYLADLKLDEIADNSRGMLNDEKPPRITDADVVHSEMA
jgi:hypothetical protein